MGRRSLDAARAIVDWRKCHLQRFKSCATRSRRSRTDDVATRALIFEPRAQGLATRAGLYVHAGARPVYRRLFSTTCSRARRVPWLQTLQAGAVCVANSMPASPHKKAFFDVLTTTGARACSRRRTRRSQEARPWTAIIGTRRSCGGKTMPPAHCARTAANTSSSERRYRGTAGRRLGQSEAAWEAALTPPGPRNRAGGRCASRSARGVSGLRQPAWDEECWWILRTVSWRLAGC